MASKESESYRLQVLRRLKQKDSGPPPSEVLEAEKVIAKHREEQAQARAAIPRASAPLPNDGRCPDCHIYHNIRSILVPEIHPESEKGFDRLRCPICGYTEDSLPS